MHRIQLQLRKPEQRRNFRKCKGEEPCRQPTAQLTSGQPTYTHGAALGTSTARPTYIKSALPLLEGTTRPCFHPLCFLSLWGLMRMRFCEIDCPHVPPDWLLTRPPSPPHTSPPGCTEGPPQLSEKWREPFSSLPRPLVIRAEEVQCDNS